MRNVGVGRELSVREVWGPRTFWGQDMLEQMEEIPVPPVSLK